MSKFDKTKVLKRYMGVVVMLTLLGFAVLGKATYTMTVKKDYWAKVSDRLKSDSDSVKPNRGNIFSADGQLLASSIPEYKIFMDYQAGDAEDTAWVRKRDSIWAADLDSLCRGLHRIFPEKSAADFRQRLEEGKNKTITNRKGVVTRGARHWPVWRRRISYNTFCEVRQLPFFNLPPNKGGFHWEKFDSRRHPFGTLAERTIGNIRSHEDGRDTARFGIELSFDSLLRGEYGIERKQKVLNKFVNITVAPPVDGADVVTTIDVGMQDLAEQALLEELHKDNASKGVAILMEVETGDVKAIVNMQKGSDGVYREAYNDAISYRCEPGSVFKTASILVALDDGVVDTSYVIHTGDGVMKMHGANMKDHNWLRGGYGDMNVAHALRVSSNIGVSYVIDNYYGKDPQKFVNGLRRVGIGQDLQLGLQGYLPPNIRDYNTKTTNRALYWSKTTLPWMSIGYETQIAPINTVAFYNAIANNGRMMRPRFVKQVEKDGQVILETHPEVIKEQIAKPQAIATMQDMLRKVVSEGLGRKAGSKSFPVSGKTGTAQVAQLGGGYKHGQVWYWLSFCGYFPSNAPRYTCIVCLLKPGLPASGGAMAGAVFHNIAEGVMAKKVVLDAEAARDSLSVFVPEVKAGDQEAAERVLRRLGIASKDMPQTAGKETKGMPDLRGMGARDAVYAVERRGMKARISGAGHVVSQSVPPGSAVVRGTTVQLSLQ